ncbi:MAG: HlyD family efflux transporter periplasmic adaptor subunit [Spirochaetes bacterium]|nr:HlyD family efflux transporter periplasmic adaptor subunit [Spirochaetota bacterium]
MRPWSALAVCAACAFGSVAVWAQQPGGPGGPNSGTPRVEVARAAVTEKTLTTTVGGRLRPANTVTHVASVNGIVTTVNVREGQQVKVGQRLFGIERADVAGSYLPAVIVARIEGVVSEVHVQPANEVKSGAAGVTVIDTSGYSLTSSISDKDAFKIQTGGEITGKAVGGQTLAGVLLWRSPEPDYETGLYSLTFRFPNGPGAHLGQFVSIEIPVATARGIFVPQSVLVRRYGRYFVWTVSEASTLKSRAVVTGAVYGDYILIEKGLEVGDRYLSRISRNEREDMAVVVAER